MKNYFCDLYRQQHRDNSLPNPNLLKERFEKLEFQDVLNDLNMTREEYINALRMTIKGKAACFHERRTKNLFINNYNPRMLLLNSANMDLTWISGRRISSLASIKINQFYLQTSLRQSRIF